MKVKIISTSDANLLENMVNAFIADKKVIDIKYQSMRITTTYGMGGVPAGGLVNDRALIMYEELEEKDN